jgi:hypothetical protein
MPRLSSLQRAELVTETFEIAGEHVTATFDKSEVTLHWAKFAQDPETMADALASVVVEWDIQEDDGTAFPPDADNIARLPMPVIAELVKAMNRASQPSEAEGKNLSGPRSSASAASTEQTTASPNGPATSRLPVS